MLGITLRHIEFILGEDETIPPDQRRRILEAVQTPDALKITAAAALFGVHRNTIHRWCKSGIIRKCNRGFVNADDIRKLRQGINNAKTAPQAGNHLPAPSL